MDTRCLTNWLKGGAGPGLSRSSPIQLGLLRRLRSGHAGGIFSGTRRRQAYEVSWSVGSCRMPSGRLFSTWLES